MPSHSVDLKGGFSSLELSAPTNTLVLTHGNDVTFYPVQPTSSPPHTLTLPQAPSSASLHPTLGDRFVAGSTGDPWVRVYGLLEGNEMELYKGHHGPVHCVMYSPDGEMYASGSGTYSLRSKREFFTDACFQRTAQSGFGRPFLASLTVFGRARMEQRLNS